MTLTPDRQVAITCTHDCPDACRALVHVDGAGHAVAIRSDPSHAITGRHLCVKVDRYLERVYSPDRLTTPLRRTGSKGDGRYEPIGWDEALDEIVERWRGLIERHGAETILGYSYLGSMGVLDMSMGEALFHRLGATRLERSICGPQWFALSGLTARPWTDPENLPDAEAVVVWGMDPVSTSIHTWNLIRRAKRERGAPLVVVDPYRSRTAARADLHLRPHPGTDGALALAVGHMILRDGLEDRDHLDEHTTGIDAYREAVEPWTPERAAAETGVDAADIERFAELYATRRPAAIRLGVGMQRSSGAGSALRAIQCLPSLCGHWRWPTGGIAQSVSLMSVNLGGLSRPDLAPDGTRQVNMIQLGRVLNDDALDPPITALYVWNSNPAVIAADQNRVLEGLRRDDLFTVVHDQFLTDTARHADIVLPATTMLEHPDVVGSWGFSYVSWNEAAIDPVGESRSNAEVVRLLAERLGFDDDVFRRSDHELMALALDDAPAAAQGADAATVRADGVRRVGPPVGTAPNADATFAFVADSLAAVGLHPVAEYRPPAEVPSEASTYPLRLLTLKRHTSINSSYGSLPVMLRAEPRVAIEVNPADAAARGITDGAAVRVFNDRGEMRGVAAVTDQTPPGTVAVPFGRWVGAGGGGANALTSDRLGDLANGPTFCDNLVEVAPAGPD
ncbi:MAG: molybdopterin-dependent oxidoreductase [Actinomycetota bacterium]|nr:molybdopterin-dependent oxidoreductase [Actinomycetota bacterium]